jgi:hypothetical protein
MNVTRLRRSYGSLFIALCWLIPEHVYPRTKSRQSLKLAWRLIFRASDEEIRKYRMPIPVSHNHFGGRTWLHISLPTATKGALSPLVRICLTGSPNGRLLIGGQRRHYNDDDGDDKDDLDVAGLLTLIATV